MKKSKFTDSRIMEALKRADAGLAVPEICGELRRQRSDFLRLARRIRRHGMDFMDDQLKDGRSIRLLDVIDDYNREASGIEIDFSLPSARVVRALEQIIGTSVTRSRNGPLDVVSR